MEGIYTCTTSERVVNLEQELERELKDLQNEIESGGVIGKKDIQSFSSVVVPKDIKYFRNKRKLAIKNCLKVREAKQLQLQSDVMKEEMETCNAQEYTSDSLPLILHQFYVERVKDLMQLKVMHMKRWTRFCHHTKEMEAVYPEYQKRINEILLECQDAIDRAVRLSDCCEPLITNSAIPNSMVKNEDIAIYTRWLVFYLHSIKKIQHFIKFIEWIPQSRFIFHEEKSTVSPVGGRNIKSPRDYLNQEFKETKNSPTGVRSSRRKEETKKTVPCAEEKKPFPVFSTDIKDFSDILDRLLECYSIEMRCKLIENPSDEMDLYNLVLRKFKLVHFRQEQERNFPVYDSETLGDSKNENEEIKVVFKKESNWLPFVQITPEIYCTQKSAMTKLKELNKLDQLTLTQSKILCVKSFDKVLYLIKEHAKQISNPVKMVPTAVGSRRHGRSTKDVWNNLLSFKRNPSEMTGYDENIGTEDGSSEKGEENNNQYDITEAVHKLGLEENDTNKNHSFSSNGGLLSLMLLRHLKIKDLRQSILNTLNYFRSVERTLTINDVGFSTKENKIPFSKYKTNHGGVSSGIGSHQYLHNNPTDYVIDTFSTIQDMAIENFDDYYSFKDNLVHVQDQKGWYVMYEAALDDFKSLEHDLLLIASHYLEKVDKPNENGFSHTRSQTQYQKPYDYTEDKSDVDLDWYSHRNIDRFAVLYELWTCEANFQEKKRQLFDCYIEAYHHVVDSNEQRKMAQVITNIMFKRPRFDFHGAYFKNSYQLELKVLDGYYKLVKAMLDDHIVEQRHYIQKVHRDNKQLFGMPLKIVPVQAISVNASRPVLRDVFILEFHPTVAMVADIPAVILKSHRELLHMFQPRFETDRVQLEIKLVSEILKEWNLKKSFGHSYSQQARKDVFSEVFIEDPMFVCEVGSTLTASKDSRASYGVRKEEIQKMLSTWCKLLELITYRHRIMENVQECDILHDTYVDISRKIGVDECHSYLRPVSFEYAQMKTDSQTKPFKLKQLIEDESRVDRYIPNYSCIAIAELDEKHLSVFNFRNREGLMNLMTGPNYIEKIRLSLLTQICQKYVLMSAVQQVNGCYNEIRCEESKIFEVKENNFMIELSTDEISSSTKLNVPVTHSQQMLHQDMINDKVQHSLISLQAEKSFLRDRILNEFIRIKEKKQPQNIEEVLRLKQNLVHQYCGSLQTRFSQHLARGQIIAYFYSLKVLFKSFPVTRNSHFMFGEENEKKQNAPDNIEEDPTQFKQRPRLFFSRDGTRLLNLWFVPHYTEILNLFGEMDDKSCAQKLNLMLRIVSSVHDICQYLCAHARSGSSHARMGSQKLETSGITADWGGTEGIGAELREIQKQIDLLGTPSDPETVAQFLERKRDIMFMEYDLAISHAVRNTFLQSGNLSAYQIISDCMKSALQDLSNKPREIYKSNKLCVPKPLDANDYKARRMFPWRSFINRHLFRPLKFYDLSYLVEIPLYGLKNIDKHLVHGEILGVSLLLEDVVASGIPRITLTESPTSDAVERKTSSRSSSAAVKSSPSKQTRSPSAHSQKESHHDFVESFNIEPYTDLKNLSWQHAPMETAGLVYTFLQLWSRLEIVKREWGSRRLKIININSVRTYEQFQHLFNLEVIQPVYQRILSSREGDSKSPVKETSAEQIVSVELPDDVTEYEMKVRQIVRLLENLEYMMIDDCIRRLSREHTFVVSERSREDFNLPTDLWKKPSMKENIAIERPHVLEDFVTDLDIPDNSQMITFEREFLDRCFMKLGTALTNREKSNFLNSSMFYENILRQQNNLLYVKEQQIKRLQSKLEEQEFSTSVEVDCALAERSYDLLVEITAMRSKIAELEKSISEAEKILDVKYRRQYSDMVLDLFQNAFGMKTRFETYRSSLHDQVLDFVHEVRKVSIDRLRKIREKNGYDSNHDITSARLIQAEKIREVQRENKSLLGVISKQKVVHSWYRVKNKSKFESKLGQYQSTADKATKDSLEKGMLQEEKNLLMEEEQEALKKLLVNLDQECSKLRQQLRNEQKIQAQRSHIQLQEEQSFRHLELAKASNLDKLVSELEEREKELQQLRDTSFPDQRKPARSATETKRLLREAMNQVSHERNLKLDAFDRVDELQRQVHELENRITEILSKDKQTFHETCFPLVPGGRISPQKLRPISQGAMLAVDSQRPHTSARSRRPKSGVVSRTAPRSKSVMEMLQPRKSDTSLPKPSTRIAFN